MSGYGVVITGMGAASPLGLTNQQTWSALCAGNSGIKTIDAFDPAGFPCKLTGQVPDYKIRDYVPKKIRKSTKLMCRDIELAIIAADDAIKNSGLITKAIDEENINVDPARMAINIGAGLISCDLEEIAPAVTASLVDGKFDIKKWGAEGINMITPLWLLKYLPNMLACHIGIIHDIQGPSNTITCAEAGGLLAIIEAIQIINRGSSDIALAGGAEAKVNPIVLLRQCILNRSAENYNDAPEKACRPFDANASGSVFGEGASVVVLENIEHAKNRNAKIYAEVIGIGESNSINSDYRHLEPDGKGVQIAIEKAMADAGIKPEDIDLIVPTGTAIAADDLAEAKGIEAALGESAASIPVLPIKSMLSHTGAASGAFDLTTAVNAMCDSIIPAAKNCDKKADGCNLNISTEKIEKNISYALCCNYTFGGQTAAVVLKKFNG